MKEYEENRSSFSIRRALIEMNTQMDQIKDWTDQNSIDDYYSGLRIWDWSSGIPDIILDILLLEDRQFFRHRGFELRAIPRGLKRKIRYGKVGGVSTIEQLLVRTYLQRTERTLYRKAREILFAHILNFHRSKKQILVAFVSCAYFGPSLNGAETASKVIFGLPACCLSEDRSAFIASLLPYPLPRNVVLEVRTQGPFSNASDILDRYRTSNPWWVGKIEARMSYLNKLRVSCSGAF